MRAGRDGKGNFIVPEELVRDFSFWKRIAKYALETEADIERSYARTWGEEGEIALEELARELFGIELDFTQKKILEVK